MDKQGRRSDKKGMQCTSHFAGNKETKFKRRWINKAEEAIKRECSVLHTLLESKKQNLSVDE